MNRVEKALLNYIRRHIYEIALGLVFLTALSIRICFLPLVSHDMEDFLLPWLSYLKVGTLKEISAVTDFNYSTPYLYLLKGITLLPLHEVIAVKLVSILFEVLCIFAMAYLAYLVAPMHRKRQAAAMVFCLACLSPLIIMNSSAWGQCDVIYTFFTLVSFVSLVRERYTGSIFLFALAFCFKLQAIFILPLFLILYVTIKRFSALHFLCLPGMLFLFGLPAAFCGMGLFYNFQAYAGQAGEFQSLYHSYPNLYMFVGSSLEFGRFKLIGTLFALSVFIVLAAVIIKKDLRLTREGLLLFGAYSIFLCVFLLPVMHERYAFCGELLLLVCVAVIPKRKVILAAVLFHFTSLFTYISYLFSSVVYEFQYLSVLNFIAVCLLTAELFQKTGGEGKYNLYFEEYSSAQLQKGGQNQ